MHKSVLHKSLQCIAGTGGTTTPRVPFNQGK